MDRTEKWQLQNFADDAYEILPVVIGFILYYSSVDHSPHHMPIICHISRRPDDSGYRSISCAAGNIPAEELELIWSSIRGLTG